MPLHSADITIIVPTFNRADFLARLLGYYARNKFQGRILIGDASNDEQAALVRKEAERYRDSLNIEHHRFPGENIAQTVFKLNGFIRTPFAALAGDDDLLLVEGLRRCADFLKDHPHYAAANGKGCLVVVKGSKVYGDIQDLDDYPLKGVEAGDPATRLEDFLKDYSVALFSVFRTEIWRRMWADPGGIKDVDFAAELVPNCVGVISGKIKHLNVLYLIRQAHERRYVLPDAYDWVTSPQWQEGYRFFKARVREALAAQGMDEGKAGASIKAAFAQYLQRRIARKKVPVRKRVKQAIRRKFNLVRFRSVRQLVTNI